MIGLLACHVPAGSLCDGRRGACAIPGRVPFRQGMTMRDLVLLANGVTEDADLTEAEIARREQSDDPGALAKSIPVPLDSCKTRQGWPSGTIRKCRGTAHGGAPDIALMPYDNVLIRRQTGWETQRLVLPHWPGEASGALCPAITKQSGSAI